MPAANHYELLQIARDASAQELRAAFRRLSKRVHPDTTDLPQQEAEEAFRRLQQAYLTLSDPEQRRAYDASLVRLAASVLAPPAPSPARPPAQPIGVRRDLSGGEWLALLLLALAVAFSLVLGVGLAWARGAEFLRVPSWWLSSEQTASQLELLAADARSPVTPGSPLQPSAAGA